VTTCCGPPPTTARPSTTPTGLSGRSLRTGERSRACFAEAAGLFDPPVELVDVPFEGGTLPGTWSCPATASGPATVAAPRPTLIGVGGFDSSAEELYFHLGAPGAERGWNVFVFDGPGQPGACAAIRP
jgi:hypothetical protein